MTKKAQSERGAYRGIYETLYDDLDFQRLTPLAKVVWHVLKAKLKQYGIAVFYPETLPRVVNATAVEIEGAIAELERPKHGQQLGWLVRQEHVFWLVNAFRYDPSVGAGMTANHQLGARRYAETLPRLHVVEQFLGYYALSPTIGKAPPTPSPNPPPIPRGDRESESERESERESESDARARARDVPAEFLKAFYRGATPERREQVAQQLVAALSPEGVRVRKGEYVHARDATHLNRVLLDTIAQGVKDPDKAIVVVLRKLTDPELDSRGRTVTEAASADTHEEDALLAKFSAQRRVAALRWRSEHPAEFKQLEEKATTLIDQPSDVPGYEMLRKQFLTERAADAAGFPDFDTWRVSA